MSILRLLILESYSKCLYNNYYNSLKDPINRPNALFLVLRSDYNTMAYSKGLPCKKPNFREKYPGRYLIFQKRRRGPVHGRHLYTYSKSVEEPHPYPPPARYRSIPPGCGVGSWPGVAVFDNFCSQYAWLCILLMSKGIWHYVDEFKVIQVLPLQFTCSWCLEYEKSIICKDTIPSALHALPFSICKQFAYKVYQSDHHECI